MITVLRKVQSLAALSGGAHPRRDVCPLRTAQNPYKDAWDCKTIPQGTDLCILGAIILCLLIANFMLVYLHGGLWIQYFLVIRMHRVSISHSLP